MKRKEKREYDKVTHIKERQALKKRGDTKQRHPIKLIIIVLCLSGIFFLMLQLSKIQTINIDGNKRYTKSEIYEMVDLAKGDNFFEVFFNKGIDTKQYPYIKNMDIQYDNINEVTIRIEEKKIVGYIPYMNKYLCIDQDGYVIDNTIELFSDVPIFTGIDIDNFTLGERINVDDRIMNTLFSFYQSMDQYQLPVREITFMNNDIKKINLKIGKVDVFFGNIDRFNEKFAVLSAMFKEIDSQQGGSIDLSGPLDRIVFKKKEL